MKTKSLFLLVLGSFLFFPAFSQHRNCGAMDYLQQQMAKNPIIAKKFQKAKEQRERGTNNSPAVRGGGVITIPTVVHVVWNDPAENITDSQVLSQIRILNEDFRKMNADNANVPAPFTNLSADSNIEFCLASKDPDGNPTDGIVRVNTTVTQFGMGDDIKFSLQGGSDAWPSDQYCNMWVCNLGGGLLGYAQFPGGGAANTDGVVMGYTYFGDEGAVTAPYNLGRTATHEVGHWLGLYHIWGDEPQCNNDDGIADTPLQAGENYSCPTFPLLDDCQTEEPGVMFMNYMDYVDDACMIMFSVGQGDEMNSVLNGQRASLLTSLGCLSSDYDAAITGISSPSGSTICTNNISPTFMLQNFGAETLTTATITYQLDGGSMQTFNWTGSLTTNSSESVTLPSIAVSPGTHTLNITVSNPNGNTDEEPSNDAQDVTFTSLNPGTGVNLPLVEDFEGPSFPPTNWTLANPDNALTWEKYLVSQNGVARINNYDYSNGADQVDEFISPVMDISNGSGPHMTFDLAYQLYTQQMGTFSDTLEILVSTDCGASWQSAYFKYDDDLATTSPYWSHSDYVPAPADWRNETVDLTPFISGNTIQLKFKHTSNFENNIYLDNINISFAVGIENSKLANSINLFPNPSKGLYNLQITDKSFEELSIKVYNVLGEEVVNPMMTNNKSSYIPIDLSNLNNGVYYIEVSSGEMKAIKKAVKMN